MSQPSQFRELLKRLPRNSSAVHRAGISLQFEEAERSSPPSELLERRRVLLRRQEEREYSRLVGDALPLPDSGRGSRTRPPGAEARELRAALSTALNMLVALAASFAIGFYAGRQTDGRERTVGVCFVRLASVTSLGLRLRGRSQLAHPPRGDGALHHPGDQGGGAAQEEEIAAPPGEGKGERLGLAGWRRRAVERERTECISTFAMLLVKNCL